MSLVVQRYGHAEAQLAAQLDAGSSQTASTGEQAGPSTDSQAYVDWQQASHTAPPAQYASGWYYQDVQGYTQGAFTKQQLLVWRQYLPMDLLVWFIDQNGGSSHGLDLAKVLGDTRLLQSWRQANGKDVSHCLGVPNHIISCAYSCN